MFVDRHVARRLERTEGMLARSFQPVRRTMGVNTAWREIAGAIAVCDGPESPFTQTFCLGLETPAGAAELAQLEAFFTEHGAPTMHEVSPFAGVATTAALVAGGYSPIEMSNVLVREIGAASEPSNPALRVRTIDDNDEDRERWLDAALAGWATDEASAAMLRPLFEANVRNREISTYIVEQDGRPIATAALCIVDGVALFAGASTIPSARERGAQNALVSTRMTDARAQGCTLAMIVTEVGSTSQRNAQRHGFSVGYSRTKWRRG